MLRNGLSIVLFPVLLLLVSRTGKDDYLIIVTLFGAPVLLFCTLQHSYTRTRCIQSIYLDTIGSYYKASTGWKI